jgi:catalase (peroxidase I)
MSTPDQWPSPSQTPADIIASGLPPVAARDQYGRFLTGNSGGGRPKGSRNKLTERFLDIISDDFAEHGAEAIVKLRTDDPATYLKLVGSLVPRELILQREQAPPINSAVITDDEVVRFVDQRRRQKAVEDIVTSEVCKLSFG